MSVSVSFPWTFPISWTDETGFDSFMSAAVALNSNPHDHTPIFAELPNIMAVSIRRGRQRQLDRFESGTATITLKNTDGRYWPNNTTGPYYPTLVPGKKIRIRVTYDGTDYDLFTGYIESYRPGWVSDPMQGAIMILECADLLKSANKYLLNTGSSASNWYPTGQTNLSGTRVWQVIEQFVPTVNDVSDYVLGEPVNPYSTYTVPANQLRLWACLANTTTTATELVCYADISAHDIYKRHATFVVYSDNAGEPDALVAETDEVEITQRWTHVPISAALTNGSAYWIGCVTDYDTTFHVSVSGTSQRYKSFTYGTAFPDPAGAGYTSATQGGMQFFLLTTSAHDIELGNSQIAAVDTTDYSAAGDYLAQVASAEQGQLYVAGDGRLQYEDRDHRVTAPHDAALATFGDGALEMKYRLLDLSLDDEYIYNEVRLTGDDGVEQVARDQPSIDAYGRRVLRRTIIARGDDDVHDQGEWLLSRYKDPLMRLKAITILPAADPANLYPKALGYEISDRICVKLAVAGLNDDFFIEGISHDWSADGTWQTRWQLSPAWDTGY